MQIIKNRLEGQIIPFGLSNTGTGISNFYYLRIPIPLFLRGSVREECCDITKYGSLWIDIIFRIGVKKGKKLPLFEFRKLINIKKILNQWKTSH